MKDEVLTYCVLIICALVVASAILITLPSGASEDDERGILPIRSPADDTDDIAAPLFRETFSRYFGLTPEPLTDNESRDVEIQEEPQDPVIIREPDDDDLFLITIGTQATPIAILSMQSTIAIDRSHACELIKSRDALAITARETWHAIEAMNVSGDQLERKHIIQESMIGFIAATSALQRGLPSSETDKREVLQMIRSATSLLRRAVSDIGGDLEIPEDDELHRTALSLMSTPEKPDGLLPCGTPYIYRDATESNEISISPRYTRMHTSYWYHADNEVVAVDAPPGSYYLFVLMQVTHRGNLDGRRYTITTPRIDAFSLSDGLETYKPISNVRESHLGEMYRSLTLNRRESVQQFLLFEVPENLRPQDTYLTLDLGSVWGRPSWDLA